MEIEIPEKLLSKRLVTPSGCWEWTGTRNRDGYGFTYLDGKHRLVHRYIGCLALGLKQNTVFKILHTCDNPPCFNPDHLFKGTSRDNTKDAVSKGRFGSNRGKSWRNR